MDLIGQTLTAREAQMLQHKAVAGLILFTRNFKDKEQLTQLIRSVRDVQPNLLVTVDHEGGRVQRFTQDFTNIPPMLQLLKSAKGNRQKAENWAQDIGWLMASELLEVGIDLTFAPVLDRGGISGVIGHRAFSDNVDDIAPIASSLIDGFAEAGMKSCAKHFPGHGGVQADTHLKTAIDSRTQDEVENFDMQPFIELIQQDKLASIMPAHVTFPAVDQYPTGFSKVWLQTILREKYQFKGTIFSDDLSMHAASTIGGYQQRVQSALDAGCDSVLLCNDSQAVEDLLKMFSWPSQKPQAAAQNLCSTALYQPIKDVERYKKVQRLCQKLCSDVEITDS